MDLPQKIKATKKKQLFPHLIFTQMEKNNQIWLVFLWVLLQHNFVLELKTTISASIFSENFEESRSATSQRKPQLSSGQVSDAWLMGPLFQSYFGNAWSLDLGFLRGGGGVQGG